MSIAKIRTSDYVRIDSDLVEAKYGVTDLCVCGDSEGSSVLKFANGIQQLLIRVE